MSARKTPPTLEKNSLKHVLAVGMQKPESSGFYIAYIYPGDNRENTYALLAPGNGVQLAFPASMLGDYWPRFHVINSYPIEPNDDKVQSTLDRFMKGWRNASYVKELVIALEAMGYTVP